MEKSNELSIISNRVDKEITHRVDNVIQCPIKEKTLSPESLGMGAKRLKAELQSSKWYLVPSQRAGKDEFSIRRYKKVDGKTKWERYDKAEYRSLKPGDLKAFVTRLNGERMQALARAKAAFEINHVFITQDLLEQWETHIIDSQNNVGLAHHIIQSVQRNFLHFFVNNMRLPDPMDWYEKQEVWGKALLNQKHSDFTTSEWESMRILPEGKIWSEKSIKDQIMFANRFIAFLHRKKPRLFPLLVFSPIAKAVLKKHEANRNMADSSKYKWFVRPEHWELMCNGDRKANIQPVDTMLIPFMKLAYLMGMRDAETLGVKLSDVGKNLFDLQRQIIAFPDGKPQFGPLKGRDKREIPYWMSSPKEIYLLIKNLPPLMHQNTLSRWVSEEMQRLGLPYTMHDFRRTWITNCLHAGRELVKVKEAAGHKQISTTNLYILNMDSVDNSRYSPEDD